MIKANELRCGNMVLYKPYGNRDGERVTIAGILGMQAYFNKYTNESGMFHNLQPIPLTEEWLERMGFQKMLQSADPDYGPIEWSKEYPVSYQSGPEYFTLWPNEGGSNGNFLLDNYSAAPLKYVHQLQNLYFAVCGEELTIKL